jgi:hypothetical protein
MRPLNEIMEFDHVIRVLPDGSIQERVEGVYAPELYDGELAPSDEENGWWLMNGYSGQHGYSGPIMHQSEFIGGGMERDIRNTPGLYVALANMPTDGDMEEITGWAVAYIPD